MSFEPSSYDIRARESILVMLKTGVQNKTDYLVSIHTCDRDINQRRSQGPGVTYM